MVETSNCEDCKYYQALYRSSFEMCPKHYRDLEEQVREAEKNGYCEEYEPDIKTEIEEIPETWFEREVRHGGPKS